MAYDEKLCDEKHENIKLTLKNHEDRLNGHSKRLDTLEQNDRENHTEIKNLIKSKALERVSFKFRRI